MDRGILDATRAAQSNAAGRLLDSAVLHQAHNKGITPRVFNPGILMINAVYISHMCCNCYWFVYTTGFPIIG